MDKSLAVMITLGFIINIGIQYLFWDSIIHRIKISREIILKELKNKKVED